MDAFVFIPAKHACMKLKATSQRTMNPSVQYNKSLYHLFFGVLHFSQFALTSVSKFERFLFLCIRFPTRSPYFSCPQLYSAERYFKMAVLQTYKGDYYLWNYVPSMPGAVVFIVLFVIMSVVHCWRIFKTGTKFCWPFAIGCICKSNSLVPDR